MTKEKIRLIQELNKIQASYVEFFHSLQEDNIVKKK